MNEKTALCLIRNLEAIGVDSVLPNGDKLNLRVTKIFRIEEFLSDDEYVALRFEGEETDSTSTTLFWEVLPI